MAGPGDQGADAPGRDYLRASHADREHVIGVLKVAFVQGRLTKGELDARVGQAFSSKTYGELAALTADLPAGLARALPPRGTAGGRARSPVSKVAKVVIWCTSAIPLSAVWTAVSLSGTERFDRLFVLVLTLTLAGWTAAITVEFASWQEKRSRGQLPPGAAQGGQARRQGGRPGTDLTLCQAHRGYPRPSPALA
jgi:DUF1707 SHOCT-like domain